MSPRPAEDVFDYDSLAEYLSALSYPARLELLHILRFPHVLGEIRVSPRRGPPSPNPDRAASRPAILGHLERLETVDLVRVDEIVQSGRAVSRYVLNSPKLYEIAEELRRLCVIHAGRGATGDATTTLDGGSTASPMTGPRLVLVHGLYEGKSFSLDPAKRPEAEWTIGRRKGLAVTLDYDPFVSMENSTITLQNEKYAVTDNEANKNGTTVNWARLPKGSTQELRTGDVLGVGRSLLSFVEK